MKSLTTSQTQAIALAGIIQSAYLVDEIARTGTADERSFTPLLQSLFEFNPEHPAAIYGGVQGVNLGLKLLQTALGGDNNYNLRPSLSYAIPLIHLQGQLSKSPDMLNTLSNRLQHIQYKTDHFTNDINEIYKSVAAVYQDTISTFKTRIKVNGNAVHLQNSANADKIRTLLLAGIRASVLWRQVGGKRWQLFFARKRLLAAAKQLLADNQ